MIIKNLTWKTAERENNMELVDMLKIHMDLFTEQKLVLAFVQKFGSSFFGGKLKSLC